MDMPQHIRGRATHQMGGKRLSPQFVCFRGLISAWHPLRSSFCRVREHPAASCALRAAQALSKQT